MLPLSCSILSWSAISINGICGYTTGRAYLLPYFELNCRVIFWVYSSYKSTSFTKLESFSWVLQFKQVLLDQMLSSAGPRVYGPVILLLRSSFGINLWSQLWSRSPFHIGAHSCFSYFHKSNIWCSYALSNPLIIWQTRNLAFVVNLTGGQYLQKSFSSILTKLIIIFAPQKRYTLYLA